MQGAVISGESRRWPVARFRAGPLLALLIGGAWSASGCSGGLANRREEGNESQVQPWVKAAFPVVQRAPVRVDHYPDQITLVREGRVYGSSGARDMPGQVAGMLTALAVAPRGPTMQRVGVLGFGTGASVAVALAAGSRLVDVFEDDPQLVAAGRELAEVTGLTYQDNLPVHPALRFVSSKQAAGERFLRYDLLVSPAATTVLAGPGELVTVERLQNLTALLSTGGLLVHHLPAYDMLPETYRRLLRTFAEAFSYLLVFAAEPQGGDTFVVASSVPIRFRDDFLRTLASNPDLVPALRAARASHPMDLVARLLFASRDEVLTFADGAEPCTARSALPANALPPRPPVPAPTAPANERSAWEQAVTRYEAQFQRMDLVRQEMFGLDWPHGSICPHGPGEPGCLFSHLDRSERGAEVLAELSLSLMAGGRFLEAQSTLDTAAQLSRVAAVAQAEEVRDLLLGDPPDLSSRLPSEADQQLRQAIRRGRCGEALPRVNAFIEGSGETSSDNRLVGAYALVRCRPEQLRAMNQVASLLEPLVDDAVYARRYPLFWYLAARSAMVRGLYDEATWRMVDFVRSSSEELAPAASPDSEEKN